MTKREQTRLIAAVKRLLREFYQGEVIDLPKIERLQKALPDTKPRRSPASQ